jgi:hypothetical protein
MKRSKMMKDRRFSLKAFQSKDKETQVLILKHLAKQHYEVGRLEDFQALETLLSSFYYMQTKLNTLGAEELIDDYDYVKDVDFLVIQEALRLSTQALREDASQLYAQLYGRLHLRQTARVQKVLGEPPACSWLRCLNRALIPAEGAILLNIIAGTGAKATVTPDGELAVTVHREAGKWIVKVWAIQTGTSSIIIPLEYSISFYDVADILPNSDGKSVALIMKQKEAWEMEQWRSLGLVLLNLEKGTIIHSEEINNVGIFAVASKSNRAVFLVV